MTVGGLQPFKDVCVCPKAKTPSFQHDYGISQTFKRKMGVKMAMFCRQRCNKNSNFGKCQEVTCYSSNKTMFYISAPKGS